MRWLPVVNYYTVRTIIHCENKLLSLVENDSHVLGGNQAGANAHKGG
jgi:hypothetical protein